MVWHFEGRGERHDDDGGCNVLDITVIRDIVLAVVVLVFGVLAWAATREEV